MKFDRSNKFDFCYYEQVNTFGGNIYYLLAIVQKVSCITDTLSN